MQNELGAAQEETDWMCCRWARWCKERRGKRGHTENRPVGPEAVGPDLVCHMAYLGLKIGPSLGLLLG